MNEYYTVILPLVLTPPIVIGFILYKWVVPVWFDSFRKE